MITRQKSHLKASLICLLLSFSFLLNASDSLHEFKTSRMKSTANTGVASFLQEESHFLNPASLAFFNTANMYFQKGKSELSSQENSRQNLNAGVKSTETAFVVTDTTGALKGSVFYLDTNEGLSSRKSYGAALAQPIEPKTTYGVSWKHFSDHTYSNSSYKDETYSLFDVAILHALNESFSVGLVAKDILHKRPNETRAYLGVQYVYQGFVTVMFDTGADYHRELKETGVVRGAIQFKIWNDFLLRFGFSDDSMLKEGLAGIGLSWYGPRFGFDLALETKTDHSSMPAPLKSKNSSFSISYRF